MRISKWLMNGLALCAISTPLSALEVYNNEESGAKVEVYGNIRGYIMESAGYRQNALYTATTGLYDYGAATNRNWNVGWNAGLQTNSRLGAKFTIGKFLGVIELGAHESSLFSTTNEAFGARLIYGQYDFGKAGKITFGKTNTPTVVTGFVNDVMATDNGAWGFGALPISVRKFQLQYSIFGATIALIEDSAGSLNTIYDNNNTSTTATTTNLRLNFMPRIALAYDYKGEKVEAKIGLSYRYTASYNKTTDGTNSFHILGAGKFHFLDKKMYLSLMLHYGLNANEERVVAYLGGYNHTEINTFQFINDTTQGTTTNTMQQNNLNVAGLYLEMGYNFSEKVALRVGLGGQTAFGLYRYIATNANLSINGITVIGSGMIMANLPIKVHKFITITPQLGYYATAIGTDRYNNTAGTPNMTYMGGFAGVLRAEFNF